uniref:Uncharacterized protein n=1 Tax=Rhizophora mucronata TaxID=61149 RepID=A0A2P2QQU9_RHIMU
MLSPFCTSHNKLEAQESIRFSDSGQKTSWQASPPDPTHMKWFFN